MNQTPKPSAIVLMASGAVTFLFSFFAFFKLSFGFGSTSFNAWSSDGGTLLIATWPAIFGLIIAGLVAASTFADFEVPEILTFTPRQLYVALAIPGLLIMLGYLIHDGSKGFGFWLMLLGSIGLVAGSIMELLDIGGDGASGGGLGGQQGQQGPQAF